MKRIWGVIGLVWLGLSGVRAQGYQQLKGIAIDESSGKPVGFAYVSIAGKAWGTLANAEGRFLLKYPKLDAQKEVVVSAAGFQNAVIPLEGRKVLDSVSVGLKPVVRPEVPIGFRRKTDARSLVRSALQSIPVNFQATPTVLTGFYRETLTTDTACWNVREAVLKAEKLPMGKTELPEKVKLVKGRQRVRNPLPKMLEGYAFPNGAAIVTRSMDLGPPDYLNGDGLNEYDFKLDSLLTGCDNRLAYRLTFAPAPGRRVRAARTGELWVDTASRAIVRIAYEFTPEAAGEVLKTSLKSVFDNLTGRSKKEVKRVASQAHYRQLNGKWFLQDSQLVLETLFSVPHAAPVCASLRLHFVTSEYARSNGQAIKETEMMTVTETWPKQGGSYDERFWGNFNTVLLTDTEREIVKP